MSNLELVREEMRYVKERKGGGRIWLKGDVEGNGGKAKEDGEKGHTSHTEKGDYV